jgi:hypothetical protein
MPFAAGKVKKTNVFLSEIREGLRDRARTPFFGLGLYGIRPCVARSKLVHHVVGVFFRRYGSVEGGWVSADKGGCGLGLPASGKEPGW